MRSGTAAILGWLSALPATILAFQASKSLGTRKIGQASAAPYWKNSSRRSIEETFGAEPCTART